MLSSRPPGLLLEAGGIFESEWKNPFLGQIKVSFSALASSNERPSGKLLINLS